MSAAKESTDPEVNLRAGDVVWVDATPGPGANKAIAGLY